MSLAISNAKNVVIKNFSVIQPQFWASIIIESENVLIQDFYVNATSYNPSVSSSSSFETKLRTGNIRQEELAREHGWTRYMEIQERHCPYVLRFVLTMDWY
jgi:hypothetical protein